MIASLPMYDLGPVQAANDTFWKAIATHLPKAPDYLRRDGDPWRHWRDPDLMFSQTCGLPFRAKLHSHVQYLCTPNYGLPDCPDGYYFSYIVARDPDTELETPVAAVNDGLSQSGWAALNDWAARSRVPLAPPKLTGSHAASLRMVQEGLADIAAIDAVTWRMINDHGAGTDGVHIIGQSHATPSLPFICGENQDADLIRSAVNAGFDQLDAATKRLLGITSLTRLTPQDYLAHPLPPELT